MQIGFSSIARHWLNRQQEAQLALTLDTGRHLWNKALADRKNAWEREGISRSGRFAGL
jgi:hypothetical protein